MSKWYATVRDGKEVISGKGFAAVVTALFIGIPLLSMLLMVYVYKTRTLESLYSELKVGIVGFSIIMAVIVFSIVQGYFRLTKQSLPDESKTPTDSEVR